LTEQLAKLDKLLTFAVTDGSSVSAMVIDGSAGAERITCAGTSNTAFIIFRPGRRGPAPL
jgi:hypothetical protein